MKKWVEVKRGYIVELDAVKKVSAGDHNGKPASEGLWLFLEFSGSKDKMTIPFDSVEEKWEGYDIVKKALIPDEETDT